MKQIIIDIGAKEKKDSNVVKTGALLSSLQTIYKEILLEFLISDAAGEYKDIVRAHQECWIHELRRYREIKISSNYVKEELDLFFEMAWDLFDLMETYKIFPTQELRAKIKNDFGVFFEKEWHSFMINHCRANTLSRKEGWLRFFRSSADSHS